MSNASSGSDRHVSNVHRRDSTIDSSVYNFGGSQTQTTIGKFTLVHHPERYYHKVTIWATDYVVQFCADIPTATMWAESAQRGNWRF